MEARRMSGMATSGLQIINVSNPSVSNSARHTRHLGIARKGITLSPDGNTAYVAGGLDRGLQITERLV